MGAKELAGPSREVTLRLMEKLPIVREGTMVETADAIEFLASDRAAYITGIDLLINGGMVAATRTATA
jgi:NAD(P)-dependent dehydrogenase (short-subunit alcohol dehydrogenase family)